MLTTDSWRPDRSGDRSQAQSTESRVRLRARRLIDGSTARLSRAATRVAGDSGAALASALISAIRSEAPPERWPLPEVRSWSTGRTSRPTRLRCERSSCLASGVFCRRWSGCTHRCRLERAEGLDQEFDQLILHETGNGAVVGRVMMLLTEVIAPAHGVAGRELAQASRSDLARHLFWVIDRIGHR